MIPKLTSHQQNLYETDYLNWIEITVEQLKNQTYEQIDWENLIEEIDDLGRSERRSLKSNLIVIITHLLKWQYQPELRSGSWKGSIVKHRRWVRDALQDSPSIKRYLEDIFLTCYGDAVEQASVETGLLITQFPCEYSYTVEQILESNFFPSP